jgi:hypothetical protein
MYHSIIANLNLKKKKKKKEIKKQTREIPFTSLASPHWREHCATKESLGMF